MSAKEAAEILSAYSQSSLTTWLVTVGCVAVALLYAAYQCGKRDG
jgi:hypothetical protein